mmetsp:Transcript_29700/g.83730  ORF Transcript_29700/g.83730 Transcript_29700/m.83730 type:complete len:103 (+) Transcript_29700:86-394(+)
MEGTPGCPSTEATNSGPSLPSVATSLAVPADFIVQRVRNKSEAGLLGEVATLAVQVDRLIAQYSARAIRSQPLQNVREQLQCSQDPALTSSIPALVEVGLPR